MIVLYKYIIDGTLKFPTVISCLTLFGCVFFMTACGKKTTISNGSKLVEFTLIDKHSNDSTTLKVSRRYLPLAKNRRGGLVRERVIIHTEIQESNYKENYVEYSGGQDRVGSDELLGEVKNKLVIKINSSTFRDDFIDRIRAWYRKKYSKYPSAYKSIEGYYTPCDGGREECTRLQPINYFTSEDYSGHWVMFYCPAESYRAKCFATTSFDGWEVNYFFQNSELYRWQKFDGRVRELLETFWIDSEEIKNNRLKNEI